MYERSGSTEASRTAGIGTGMLHHALEAPRGGGVALYGAGVTQAEITAPACSIEDIAAIMPTEASGDGATDPGPTASVASEAIVPVEVVRDSIPRAQNDVPPPKKPPENKQLAGGEAPDPHIGVEQFRYDLPVVAERQQVASNHEQNVQQALKTHRLYVDVDGPGAETVLDMQVEGQGGRALLRLRGNNEVSVGFFQNDTSGQPTPDTASWETYMPDGADTLRSDDNNYGALLADLPRPGTLSYAQQLDATRQLRGSQLVYREIDHDTGKQYREVAAREGQHIGDLIRRAEPLTVSFHQLVELTNDRQAAHPDHQPTRADARLAAAAFNTFVPHIVLSNRENTHIKIDRQTGDINGHTKRERSQHNQTLCYELGVRVVQDSLDNSYPYINAWLQQNVDPRQLAKMPTFQRYANTLSQLEQGIFTIDIRYTTVNGELWFIKTNNVFTTGLIPVTNMQYASGRASLIDFRTLRNAVREPRIDGNI